MECDGGGKVEVGGGDGGVGALLREGRRGC